MLSSYFIELRTNTQITVEDYDAAAGKLSNLLVSVLADTPSMNALTSDTLRDSCHSEIEIGLEEGELVAKVVVEISGPNPVPLAKAKLNHLLRARPEADDWKGFKLTKRQVPVVADTFGQ